LWLLALSNLGNGKSYNSVSFETIRPFGINLGRNVHLVVPEKVDASC
jgi:hypothetical protein